MTVFFNGDFVPESQARLSIQDRGFLYGDGLFETVLLHQGRPFRWEAHWDRLASGAATLRLPLPYSCETMHAAACRLARDHRMNLGLLRLTVSRGPGPRGYLPPKNAQPTVIAQVHPAADLKQLTSWRLHTASIRHAADTVSALKSASRLMHVMARMEADEHQADEALLLDRVGHLTEGTAGNLFWVDNGDVVTPPLDLGGLPGVTRGVVLELCASEGIKTREVVAGPEAPAASQGVFLTLSSLGIVEAATLDGRPLNRSPLVAQLHRTYWERVEEETGGSGKIGG